MGTTYFKQKRQINKPIFEGNTDFLIPTVDKYPAQVIEGKNLPDVNLVMKVFNDSQYTEPVTWSF